jgi:DNA-binding CsgD family transcriptional regulator/ketosteroid isomerase-like protein
VRAAPPIKHAPVHAWFAAYDARDIDAMCRVSHPEIVVVPRRPLLSKLQGARFHGRAGVRTLMQWSFATYPRSHIESIAVRDVESFAFASTTFLVDDRPGAITRSDVYTLFDVTGETLRRVYTFADESEALAAASRRRALTPREREVFQMVAQGLTVQQIADALYLSPATVRTHVRNGIAHLGAGNKAHAISLALKHGEIS